MSEAYEQVPNDSSFEARVQTFVISKTKDQIAALISRKTEKDVRMRETRTQIVARVAVAYELEQGTTSPEANAVSKGLLLGVDVATAGMGASEKIAFYGALNDAYTNESGVLEKGTTSFVIDRYARDVELDGWVKKLLPKYNSLKQNDLFYAGLGCIACTYDLFKEMYEKPSLAERTRNSIGDFLLRCGFDLPGKPRKIKQVEKHPSSVRKKLPAHPGSLLTHPLINITEPADTVNFEPGAPGVGSAIRSLAAHGERDFTTADLPDSLQLRQ